MAGSIEIRGENLFRVSTVLFLPVRISQFQGGWARIVDVSRTPDARCVTPRLFLRRFSKRLTDHAAARTKHARVLINGWIVVVAVAELYFLSPPGAKKDARVLLRHALLLHTQRET